MDLHYITPNIKKERRIRMKVYIVNKGGHNHEDAQRFGELVALSEGNINRFAANSIYRRFVTLLRNSSPEDYILITGLSIMSSIACSIFGRLHGRLNLLLYKTTRGEREGYYVERTIMIDELLSHEGE